MYMSFSLPYLSFIFLKLCNEVSAGLGCFCLCFCVYVCVCWLGCTLAVSGNSVTDSSGNEKVSQEKFAPCILTPPPHFLFWQVFKHDTRFSWNTHGRVCVLFNYITNKTLEKVPKTLEDIFLMLKTSYQGWTDCFTSILMTKFSSFKIMTQTSVL